MPLHAQPADPMGRVMAVNHHLKIALDLVSDAVAIIDCGPLASQGPPILYANRALAAACGMDPAALVGQPLAAITADPAPLLAALRIGHPEPTPVKGTLPGRIPCSWLCAPVRDASGRTIAKGVTAYSSADIQRIAGRRTEEAEALLGYRGRPAIIHRDDMVRL